MLTDNSLDFWYFCCENIVRHEDAVFHGMIKAFSFSEEWGTWGICRLWVPRQQHTVNTTLCPWTHWEFSPWGLLQLEASQNTANTCQSELRVHLLHPQEVKYILHSQMKTQKHSLSHLLVMYLHSITPSFVSLSSFRLRLQTESETHARI